MPWGSGCIIWCGNKRTSCTKGLVELKCSRMWWWKILEDRGCIVNPEFVIFIYRASSLSRVLCNGWVIGVLRLSLIRVNDSAPVVGGWLGNSDDCWGVGAVIRSLKDVDVFTLGVDFQVGFSAKPSLGSVGVHVEELPSIQSFVSPWVMELSGCGLVYRVHMISELNSFTHQKYGNSSMSHLSSLFILYFVLFLAFLSTSCERNLFNRVIWENISPEMPPPASILSAEEERGGA